MPDPLNPIGTREDLVRELLQRYPSLTPEELAALGDLAAYDLTITPQSEASTSPATNSEAPSKP